MAECRSVWSPYAIAYAGAASGLVAGASIAWVVFGVLNGSAPSETSDPNGFAAHAHGGVVALAVGAFIGSAGGLLAGGRLAGLHRAFQAMVASVGAGLLLIALSLLAGFRVAGVANALLLAVPAFGRWAVSRGRPSRAAGADT